MSEADYQVGAVPCSNSPLNLRFTRNGWFLRVHRRAPTNTCFNFLGPFAARETVFGPQIGQARYSLVHIPKMRKSLI
jgi:hypothetical protein